MSIDTKQWTTWRGWSWSASLVLVCLIAIVFWPGLYADWGRDDFVQLAMARMVETPWVFFTTDHYPVPGTLFRPLGFASLWLSQEIAGTDFWPHALLTLALYAGIALALFATLREFEVALIPALLATLLFALHPVAVGTALWWSARFDLLATLFVVLSLLLAHRTTRRPGAISAGLTLTTLMAAMLSKEIGLIGIAAVLLIWQHWIWTDRSHFRFGWTASLLCLLSAAVFLVWRTIVLDTADSLITADTHLLSALSDGMTRWMLQIGGYISFSAQLALPIWMLAGIALLLLTLILSTFPFRFGQRRAPLLLLSGGVLLLFLPGLIQAPVARLNAAPLTGDVSAVEAAMQSRLYFMSLAGLSMIVAWVLQSCLPAPRHRFFVSGMLLTTTALIGLYAYTSHQQAEAYARVSRDNAQLAHAAVASVQDFDWPAAPCHLVFKDIDPPAEWDIYVAMDSVIKALHPELHMLDHCFIHANYPTHFYLLASQHANAASAPVSAIHSGTTAMPRRQVGGLTFAYLRQLQSLEPEKLEELPEIEIEQGKLSAGM